MKKACISLIIALVFITFAYALDFPVNLEITHDGSNVNLSWDAVTGANSYIVSICDTPDGVFERDETGTFISPTTWTKPQSSTRKFYHITAVKGLEPVFLGTAENFVILAKSAISSATASSITGNLGISPAAATYITGLGLILDPTGVFSTSTQVEGRVYAADYTTPTPSNLTVAILDMQAAYVDAAGRPTPDFVNLNSGEIGGLTLVPGLYTWDGPLSVSAPVTLDGGLDDVWIFQVAGSIEMQPGVSMILGGSARAGNVFWQTFGPLTLRSGSHLEGNVLCSTAIDMEIGASVNGRLLSGTAVSMDQNDIVVLSP